MFDPIGDFAGPEACNDRASTTPGRPAGFNAPSSEAAAADRSRRVGLGVSSFWWHWVVEKSRVPG